MGKWSNKAREHFQHPGPMETNDLGPEMFTNPERTVISWAGANYYLACGAPVYSYGEEDTSEGKTEATCVKPRNHKSKVHESFDGFQRTESDDGVHLHPEWVEPGRHLWTKWYPQSRNHEYRTCVHPECNSYETRKAPK